jgi:hypothetical protein
MKKLNPIWFVTPPYDPEHKEYILLDYLKQLGEGINNENCYTILRSLSRVVRDLNQFKENRTLPNYGGPRIPVKDKKLRESFSFEKLANEEKEAIGKIIENSLETLYEYSEICLEFLKDEEEKIKIFKVDFEKNSNKKGQNSGILVIRNMISDKIVPYIWKGAVKLKTEEGDKEICILKKIPVKNPIFSMNYEFIYHEVLEEAGIKNSSPEFFVIEIYENFDEESEIYKLAKEKFVDRVTLK